MAGSINLSLSQQLDITNGRLLSGGKLYTFAPGTTTPQLAYRDSGLTLPHPNPITLASDGRVPQLYFADGSIRCRLLNSAGVVQFDSDNILVIGPSSGGGGGGSVDPNAIFQTGDVMWLDISGTRAGWVRDNGRTIGSATSGASERANVDCQNLFLYLWANFSDTLCPVPTGRGANAAADWAANKQITLPDKRGYVPGGVTDMGNADSLRLVGVPFSVGSPITAGSLCGESKHALLQTELPTTIGKSFQTGVASDLIGPNNIAAPPGGIQTPFWPGPTTIGALDIVNVGGGSTSNVTQRTVLGTFFRKL